MTRARGSPRRQLPDDVYGELIDILFRSMSPLINMGVVVACIGGLLYFMTGDLGVIALTVASSLLTIVRVVLNLAYKRRRKGAHLTLAEVKHWEMIFGVGGVVAAAMLGLINMRALMVGTDAVSVLVSGIMFGYCAGAVIRVSVRPVIVGLCLLSVVSLTVFGFIAHSGELHGQDRFALICQAFVILVFAVGTIEMVNHLYRTTLDQLMTKSMLSHLARKDPLTGLSNRLSLRERFDQDMIKLRRSGDLIALHFVDLDRFKAVNDNHGHPTGDALLKMVAVRLTRALRDGDTAARLGATNSSFCKPTFMRQMKPKPWPTVLFAKSARLTASMVASFISAPVSASPWRPRMESISIISPPARTPHSIKPRAPNAVRSGSGKNPNAWRAARLRTRGDCEAGRPMNRVTGSCVGRVFRAARKRSCSTFKA